MPDKCPNCGTEVHSNEDSSLEPTNLKLRSDRSFFKIPFNCIVCGAIQFKYQAIRDVVFLYPVPKPEKIGSIHIPDYDGRSHNTQESLRSPAGIVLSLGTGAYDKKGRWHPSLDLEVGDAILYNKDVPWKMDVEGSDQKKHTVVYCGYRDLYLKLDDQQLMEFTGFQMAVREF